MQHLIFILKACQSTFFISSIQMVKLILDLSVLQFYSFDTYKTMLYKISEINLLETRCM